MSKRVGVDNTCIRATAILFKSRDNSMSHGCYNLYTILCQEDIVAVVSFANEAVSQVKNCCIFVNAE